MTTITVKASTTYQIHIGSGLLSHLGDYIHTLEKVNKVCIVSDSTVYSLYGKQTEKQLEEAGFFTVSYVFPAGEASKNSDTFLSLLHFLAEYQFTRTDLIVALGGGVVGDMAGFTAAVYLRGIRYLQIPTTLLAAVDSSVGGKTAIDLPAGKNLAGAFHQPCLVLCDTDTLHTLPADIFRDGCAEVIKYAVLFDPDLFRFLMQHGLDFDREKVISRCILHKKQVVELDEYDTGLRMKLNLGHTIGHSVEAWSNYSISHGKAVAIGLAIISKAAGKMGLCSEETTKDIIQLLEHFGLPTSTDASAESLYGFLLKDKKRHFDQIHIIIPRSIGTCDIVAVPVVDLMHLLEAGLTK